MCFGSLAGTVRDLKLLMCLISQRKLSLFLRFFTRLESFEVEGNTWFHPTTDSGTRAPEEDQIVLRGSFTASEFTNENYEMLDFLATTKVEYHTITLGNNHYLTFPKLNALFEKSKNHLETLILATPEQILHHLYDGFHPPGCLDLSPCKKLVEIRARFYGAGFFEEFITVLNTVASPRFRKLTLLLTPPTIKAEAEGWWWLDREVTVLAGRVNATAVTDRLEVVFSSYSTALGRIVLPELERALPQTASDARVSLRAEILPPPLCY